MSGDPRIGFMVRHGPFAGRAGRESVDPVLAALALDLPVSVFFVGDGVYQLLSGQDMQSLQLASHVKAWRSLPMYGAERIFVAGGCLQRRGLDSDSLSLQARILDRTAMAAEMQQCGALLNV